MIILITALSIVALIGLSIFLCVYGERIDSIALQLMGALSIVCSATLIIGLCVFSFEYVASERKAQILNNEYGTKYTREDVFFASDVIDKIREIQRTRVEINGNIMGGKK